MRRLALTRFFAIFVFLSRRSSPRNTFILRPMQPVLYRHHQVPVAEEDFSKPCNDAGLSVKQVRIKADKEIIGQRKSIVEHPFGTIKRGMDAGYCLTRGLRKVTEESP
jgi:hypothetical protein